MGIDAYMMVKVHRIMDDDEILDLARRVQGWVPDIFKVEVE